MAITAVCLVPDQIAFGLTESKQRHFHDVIDVFLVICNMSR